MFPGRVSCAAPACSPPAFAAVPRRQEEHPKVTGSSVGNLVQTLFNSFNLMQWLKWEVTTQEEKTEPLLREDKPGELWRDGHGTSWGCFGSAHHDVPPALCPQQANTAKRSGLGSPGDRGLEKPIPAQGRAQGRHRGMPGMPREAPSAHSPGEDTAEAA